MDRKAIRCVHFTGCLHQDFVYSSGVILLVFLFLYGQKASFYVYKRNLSIKTVNKTLRFFIKKGPLI